MDTCGCRYAPIIVDGWYMGGNIIYCPKHAAALEMYEALKFARSVIQSGEPWTDTCEKVIGGAIALADGDSNE